jgi:hypothetical protein
VLPAITVAQVAPSAATADGNFTNATAASPANAPRSTCARTMPTAAVRSATQVHSAQTIANQPTRVAVLEIFVLPQAVMNPHQSDALFEAAPPGSSAEPTSVAHHPRAPVTKLAAPGPV